MQYFAWGINKPGVKEQRTALIHAHWDFIAKYDDSLIARGPVMDKDNLGEVIGSIHIVDVPDATAAETFVHDEPFARAGLFEDIIVERFRLELDRTQFSFQSAGNHPRFFISCLAFNNTPEPDYVLINEHQSYLKGFDRHLVCHGALIGDNNIWKGKVYFVEFSSEKAARYFLKNDPLNITGLYELTEFHRWTLGGPENLTANGSLEWSSS
tara:strand:+ start:14 stop:646 length:633 start_codon:yes stop_codon:yes gene_type:complete